MTQFAIDLLEQRYNNPVGTTLKCAVINREPVTVAGDHWGNQAPYLRQNKNYPRSKGLFLSFPHRQTMVLLSDSTIRELCSRITPTSQFSSLHFIASTAIGAKSIETRAQTLHTGDMAFGRLRAAAAKRQHEARERAFWRRTPDCRLREFSIHTADAAVTIWLPAGRGEAPVTAARIGGWRLNTHGSRYLIAMLWGLDPALRKPSITNCLVTVVCTSSHGPLRTHSLLKFARR